MTASDHFYVISLKHTLRNDRYITIWAPDDNGYRWALSRAGKYERDRVMRLLGYYNSGHSDIAVPCHILDEIAVPPIPGHHDNDTGPCVENNRTNWQLILKNIIAPPAYKPAPLYKGARKQAREGY